MVSARTHDRARRDTYLHDARNVDAYHAGLSSAIDLVAKRWCAVNRPFSGISAGELARSLDGIDLAHPLDDVDAALAELETVYLDDAVYFHDPAYVAHLNCPVVIPALLGEVVLTAVNSSLDTWDQSAGATLIERRVIDWVCDLVGLGETADGVFTSGGTQSNLQALHIARGEAAARDTSTRRLPDLLGSMRILASSECHFSVQKSASLLGLGSDAVLSVPCDSQRRMSRAAVRESLGECDAEGLSVMAVVATAGTTDFGSIDPLGDIADLCTSRGIWLHVDAAYGGGLLPSARRRHLLDGIERADSVTVDFHKAFFQPVSSSAVLVRDRSTLRHVTHHADYLNPADVDDADRPNQVAKSLQTTRRFDALKLWLSLRIMGGDAIGEMFDTVVDRADDLWRSLDRHPDIHVLCRPQLSTLVLRYAPAGADPATIDALNLRIREELFASGAAVVAGTRVGGRAYLKLTLLNPATSTSDLHKVVDLIADVGRRLATETPGAGTDREVAR
ncbi:MAG: pyridoxal phosphate-dependent decarboxylase family protein [Nocardioidaceae bacterium]